MKEHYDEAILIARGIFHKAILIEVLSARGRWAVMQGHINIAINDLNEALNYSIESNYKILEIDIRIGISWIYLKQGNIVSSRHEYELYWQSDFIDYYWGKMDAKMLSQQLEQVNFKNEETL